MSQPMAGHGPEDEGQGRDARCDEDTDPYRAPDEQLLHIRLLDTEGAERRRLGLAEEDEHRIELVLVRDEEEDGDRVREEEL